MPTVPLPGLASNAATTARAAAIAAADGVNTSLMTGTCAGWIAILPVTPAQRRGIAEVDRDRVDGLHPRRGGAGEAERARQPVRIEEAAVAVAVGLRAEF